MSPWIASLRNRVNPSRERTATVSKRPVVRRRPSCESLEGRELLTAAGLNADYTLMGGQWDNSKPVSFSIAPDGVAWDQGTNNVNAQLNGQFAGKNWQATVAAALQTWAASANLNFTPTTDGSYDFNTTGQRQGDSRFGDIRVAGYAFPTTTIAQTYGPPPNGSTAAGDVKLNTTYNYGPTGQWDFETVLIHELGHSVGLGESPQPDSVMYSYYSGVRHALTGYDVEGIQSIYGPRLADQFQARGQATAPGSAVDLGGAFNNSGSAVVNGLSLNAIGDSEYFAVTAPATPGTTLQVSAVANGHSLMSPKVTVIDAATGAILAVDAHPDQYGDTASVSIPSAQAGHRYLIVVGGATSDVFAVGDYSLQATFSGGTTPVSTPTPPHVPVLTSPVTIPILNPAPTAPVRSIPVTPTPVRPAPVTTTPMPTTVTLPGPTAPTDRYSANTSFATAAELGPIAGLTITHNVALATGMDLRVFTFEPANSGLVLLASANTTIMVGDSSGRVLASGRGLIGFQAPQAGVRYFIILTSPTNAPVADAGFAVQVVPMANVPAPTTPTVTPGPVHIGQAVPIGNTTAGRAPKPRKRHR